MKTLADMWIENEQFEHECAVKTLTTEPSEEALEFYKEILEKMEKK